MVGIDVKIQTRFRGDRETLVVVAERGILSVCLFHKEKRQRGNCEEQELLVVRRGGYSMHSSCDKGDYYLLVSFWNSS